MKKDVQSNIEIFDNIRATYNCETVQTTGNMK